MKLRQTVLFMLCLGQLSAPSQELRDISPEEGTKHLIRKVDPVYPAMGKQLHIQGDVVIQIAISETGSVKILKVSSGSPILATSAIDAVKKWQYSPFLAENKPIAVQTMVTIPFSLGDSPEKIKQQVKTNDLFFEKIDLCRKQIVDRQLVRAEETCKSAIAISDELPPARLLERMDAVRETGHALFLQKKFSAALENYQAELRIGEKTLQPYEAELAAAQYHVGNGLWGTGLMEAARVQYEKAESTYKQAAIHMDSAFLKNEYAKKLQLVLSDHVALLRQMGRTSEADTLDKEAAAIAVKQGLRDE